MNVKIKEQDVIITLISFFIILSHSVYVYTNNSILSDGIYMITTLLPLLYLIRRPIKLVNKSKMIKIFLFYYVAIILYLIFKVRVDKYISYICRFLIYIPLMILLFINLWAEKKQLDIFKSISRIMVVISVISLFFWVFGTTLHIIQPSSSVYVVWGNQYRALYYGVYLEVPGRILTSGFNRNVGIFCEAPAYCCFLCIGYLYEDIFAVRFTWKRRIIYLITILSTGTTTGILVIVYSIFIRFCMSSSTSVRNGLIKKIIIAISTILGVFVLKKVMFNSAKMASVMLRKKDYINGFSAWKQSPILGHGYMLDSTIFSTGYSSSLTQILVNGGALLISVYLIPMFSYVFIGIKRNRKYALFGIFMIILFVVGIIGYAYIMLTILAFGYAMMVLDDKI